MLIQYIMLLTVLVWSGCLVAISFMESWLKFRAPGVTLPIALSIGKLVFNALNKMEWFFALALLVSYFFYNKQIDISGLVLFSIAAGLLIIETFWLLPGLVARANTVIGGKSGSSSSLHRYFISVEALKLSSLVVLGFQLFKAFVGR